MLLLNCVICSDMFKPSDDVHITPCGHMFHYACLLQWLQRSKTCPQCRNKCFERDIIRIYFNLANLDVSRIDVGSLQEQLDNTTMQVKELEKENKKYEDEIKSLKLIQKKSMKTITGLTGKLNQNEFLIASYNEQLNILKTENKCIDEQRKEIKDLRQQIELFSSVQNILSSTSKDFEKLVNENNDVKSLRVWVTTLKRELRSTETQKADLRNSLKIAVHDTKKEHELKKILEEKLSQLESENYRLTDKLKTLENITSCNCQKRNNDSIISISPILCEPQRKKVTIDRIGRTPTTSILNKVKNIEESDSPYFRIQSSSVAPLLKHVETVKNCDHHKGALQKTHSDVTNKFSIFKNSRLGSTMVMKNPNLVFDGMGGSRRKDEFPIFPNKKPGYDFKGKSTLSSRIRNGKISKPTNLGNNEHPKLDKFLCKE